MKLTIQQRVACGVVQLLAAAVGFIIVGVSTTIIDEVFGTTIFETIDPILPFIAIFVGGIFVPLGAEELSDN